MDRSRRNSEWRIKQQLIDDDVSGLTFRFEVLPSGEQVLRIYGATLPHGNRLIRFSSSGELVQLATSVLGTERPNWPHENAARAGGRQAPAPHQTFFAPAVASKKAPLARD
jgi:hypothetical protein